MGAAAHERIVVGRVAGFYGVRGWVKVLSYTRPRANLLAYDAWTLRVGAATLDVSVHARAQGKGLVARLGDIDDRDAALPWLGAEILVPRAALVARAPLAPGEHYWADLVGLEVINLAGVTLGRVTELLETGANDVLVVQGDRERLLPYVKDAVVHAVDLDAGCIRVDWDADF